MAFGFPIRRSFLASRAIPLGHTLPFSSPSRRVDIPLTPKNKTRTEQNSPEEQ
jgi:hypothetical protein